MSASAKGSTRSGAPARLTRVITGQTPPARTPPPRLAPRRATPALQRAARRDEHRRSAPDQAGVLRRALPGDPRVLAAAGRPPRYHRAGPASVDQGNDLGGEAGPRPGI